MATPSPILYILYSIIGIIGLIFLFLIFREIILWYWRINDIADSLKRIADSLEEKSKKKNN